MSRTAFRASALHEQNVDRLTIGLLLGLLLILLILAFFLWDQPQLVVCEFGKPLVGYEVDLDPANQRAEIVPHEVGPCIAYYHNSPDVD